MNKPSVSRLKPLASHVPGAGRRQRFSDSTKRGLIDVAEELFTTHGYAATSLDAIVAGADVTKGALYHHFSGKQALFEAVFARVESQASTVILQSLTDQQDPWEKARAGLRAFLEVVQEPGYRRIVIQEGPSVLGYERYRELESRSAFSLVVDIVRAVLTAGPWELDEEMVHTFARIFFGAMSFSGETVSSAPDPATAAARVEAAIGFIVAGFQALADSGFPAPGAEIPSTTTSS